jgi:hypothetical protein
MGKFSPTLYIPVAADIDSTATNILVCGSMTSTTYSNGLNAGYALEMNMIFVYHYVHTFNIGTSASRINGCKYFGTTGNYLAIGYGTYPTLRTSNIYLIKSVTGEILKGKSIVSPSSVFAIREFIFNPVSLE